MESPEDSAIAVSVIVPVFNGEAYLEESLQSVLNQSRQDLELIVVNDASTDGTAAIIQAISDLDPRVLCLNLAENGGVSKARNLGLDAARGEFVIFLDGDDTWARSDTLELLVDAADDDTDFVEFGFFRSDMPEPDQGRRPARIVTVDLDERARLHYNVWAKLMRRQFIEDHKLRFQEGLAMGEDALFAVGAYVHASRVTRLHAQLYRYRIHAEGVTQSSWDRTKLADASRWFGDALSTIRRNAEGKRRTWMRQVIVLERMTKLSRRIGSLASKALLDVDLAAFMDVWAETTADLPAGYFTVNYPSIDHATALDMLLVTLRERDTRGFRQQVDQNVRAQARNLTLTNPQAQALATHLLKATDDPVKVSFANGRRLSLTQDEARQLGQALAANRSPTISIQLPESGPDKQP